MFYAMGQPRKPYVVCVLRRAQSLTGSERGLTRKLKLQRLPCGLCLMISKNATIAYKLEESA